MARDRVVCPGMRRPFNPDLYRIILFDQRGCGRSTGDLDEKPSATTKIRGVAVWEGVELIQ